MAPMILLDSIDQIPFDTVTTSDIRWMYGTFRPYSTGSGRDKKHFSRSGVQTPIGDIKLSLWFEVVELIAKRAGETWLVDALTKFYTERNYMKYKPPELRQEALESYSRRIFDESKWVYYLPFNRKYRPEVLDPADIIAVVTACCKRAGEVTRRQVEHAYQAQLSCPHCGRWSTFHIVPSLDWPWVEF